MFKLLNIFIINFILTSVNIVYANELSNKVKLGMTPTQVESILGNYYEQAYQLKGTFKRVHFKNVPCKNNDPDYQCSTDVIFKDNIVYKINKIKTLIANNGSNITIRPYYPNNK